MVVVVSIGEEKEKKKEKKKKGKKGNDITLIWFDGIIFLSNTLSFNGKRLDHI